MTNYMHVSKFIAKCVLPLIGREKQGSCEQQYFKTDSSVNFNAYNWLFYFCSNSDADVIQPIDTVNIHGYNLSQYTMTAER